MRDRIRTRPIAGVVCCLLAVLPIRAHAIQSVALDIGEIRAGFGSVEGARLEIGSGNPPEISLYADSIVLPAPVGRINNVRMSCPELQATRRQLACDAASATATTAQLGTQAVRVRFAYDTASRRVDLHVEGIEIAGARVQLDLSGTMEDWRLGLSGRGLDAAAFPRLAAALSLTEKVPALTGSLDLMMSARGGSGGLTGMDARVSCVDVSGSDESGRLAAESLALDLAVGAQKAGDSTWRFDAESTVTAGQLYVEPWFLEVGEAPLELVAHGTSGADAVQIADATFRQPGVVSAWARARIGLDPQPRIETATVRVDDARFPAVYRLYLQPYLFGGMFDSLATAGRAEGEFTVARGALQNAAIGAHELSVDDTHGRFAVYGVDGALHWSAEASAPESRLAWQGGFVYGIGFGPAAATASLRGRGFRLLEPLALPVLDGKLRIAELAVDSAPELTVGFDAELDPIDMRALTAALGWPSFAGRLSGRIPDLSYDQGVVTLGGDLRAEVFDGTVTVENLQLREPLGDLPRLAADVRVRGLDLETLSDTFAIGRIEGRLDGDIDNLRLFRWMPVAFDASFRTPPDDDSRHRISQRAVESISSLGGSGAAAALSSGFLQFFDTFAYARLGLGCRLENSVCHMHGVAPAPQGYYIVQGKWLPRIDVIGYESRVDWPVLVRQLESLARVDEAVVQ